MVTCESFQTWMCVDTYLYTSFFYLSMAHCQGDWALVLIIDVLKEQNLMEWLKIDNIFTKNSSWPLLNVSTYVYF